MTETEERAAKAWCDLIEVASKSLPLDWFLIWLNMVGEGSDIVRTTKGVELLPICEKLTRSRMRERADRRSRSMQGFYK